MHGKGTGNSLSHGKQTAVAYSREQAMPFSCAVCASDTRTRCKRCGLVAYCCKEHQQQDWKAHKPMCNEHAKETQGLGPSFRKGAMYYGSGCPVEHDVDGRLLKMGLRRTKIFQRAMREEASSAAQRELFQQAKAMTKEEMGEWLKLNDFAGAAKAASFLATSNMQMGYLSKFVKWQCKAREFIVHEPDVEVRDQVNMFLDVNDTAYKTILWKHATAEKLKKQLDDMLSHNVLNVEELKGLLKQEGVDHTGIDEKKDLVELIKKEVLEKMKRE